MTQKLGHRRGPTGGVTAVLEKFNTPCAFSQSRQLRLDGPVLLSERHRNFGAVYNGGRIASHDLYDIIDQRIAHEALRILFKIKWTLPMF